MKSILRLMAVAIAALVFQACSESDNPVNSDETGKAIVTVNVKSLYEKLEAITEINQEMAANEYPACIVGTVLIYDANGDLILQLTDSTRQLDPITFEVKNIPNGTYTLVACQYLGYEEVALWELTDVEKLSTVRVDYTDIYYPVITNALGVVSKTVTIDGGTIEANVTPEVAGSNLTLRVDGMREKDDISRLVVYEIPLVFGLYLNPALSDAERAYTPDKDQSWSDLEIDYVDPGSTSTWYRTFVLSTGDPTKFFLAKFNEEGDSTYVDTFYMNMLKGGTVNLLYYDFNDWNMYWKYAGSEKDFAAWKKEKEETPMIFNPCTNWGCSLEEARAHVKATHGWFNNETNGELDDFEGAWEEVFKTGANHKEYYGFETQDGQNLQYVCYQIKTVNLPVDLITNSLKVQGYELQEEPKHEEDYWFYYFLSADRSIGVEFCAYDDDIWEIWFMPNVDGTNASKRAPGLNCNAHRAPVSAPVSVSAPAFDTSKYKTRKLLNFRKAK